MSESFTVMNGVKQGGVLSPVLFAVYTDGLLLRLQESGIGCHMGGHYGDALAYADDITLISPSMTGLRKMSSICEQYASEYDILFKPIRSGLFQTANDPGGGGGGGALKAPPPTISKTVVSIFTISYMCILPGVLGMFQLEFFKNSRF